MFLSPYSLTPMHLHGAEVGRGTGKGRGVVEVGSKTQYITLQTHTHTHKHITGCANTVVHCKRTQERVLELDMKSPELTKSKSKKHTHAPAADTHVICR